MTESNIIQKYVGKKIDKVTIAMIGGNYLEFIEARTWLSDVGIQFNFEDGSFMSLFYDENTDRFDLYDRSLEDHLEGVDHYFVDLTGNDFIESIRNISLTDIKLKEILIENQDYNGQVIESYPLPVEYVLYFDNGATIQIASVTVAIDAEIAAIKNIYYNPEGNIWIAFDEIFEIQL